MKQNGLYRLEGYMLDGWIAKLEVILEDYKIMEVDPPNIKEMLTEIEALEPTVYPVNKWD